MIELAVLGVLLAAYQEGGMPLSSRQIPDRTELASRPSMTSRRLAIKAACLT